MTAALHSICNNRPRSIPGVAPTPANQLLGRLMRVKRTGRGRWLASCPAHDDKSPSLSVREKPDGTLLIHCFAGCGALDVLNSLGLQWNALFPLDSSDRSGTEPTHSRVPARDLLEIVSQDVTVVSIVAADMLAGKTIEETDWKRLAQAAARIAKARDHAC